MKFTIISKSFRSAGEAQWDLHKTGCSDISKSVKIGHYADEVEGENPQSVALDYMKDLGGEGDDLGFSLSDWNILPCCKGKAA
jgi:hypothetical protein